ncbi:hypothetical protein DWU98_13060 [Dyella monticola]|uniref:Uncharacterized protein n=1 Tax=Dyella monticola TaxID=1927958 RepID=A0A370WXS8_9GAMM|nr:hypothetical protein DWU98_13060 [Dyella monticola]
MLLPPIACLELISISLSIPPLNQLSKDSMRPQRLPKNDPVCTALDEQKSKSLKELKAYVCLYV